MIFKKIRMAPAAIIILCCAITAGAAWWAIRPGPAKRPQVLDDTPAPNDNRTRVAFSEEITVGGLIIKPLPDTAVDGSLNYQVFNSQRVALGNFNYIPWQGKNPLYLQLTGGDLILGNSSIYTAGDRLIHPLAEGSGLGYVFDYSADGSKLALAGKSGQQGDAQIYIYVKDLAAGGGTLVDTFKYPDYMSEKQAYLCWARGKLYYDYWVGDKPEVKVYDPAANQSAVFKEQAMDPQASPDSRYLALFALGAPSAKTGNIMGLELLDLESSRVIGLEGSNRVFWSNGYITVWDGDRLQLHVYDLNSGAKIKDLPADSPVADLAIDNGALKGTVYHFENKQITRQQFQVDIAAKNTMGPSSVTAS